LLRRRCESSISMQKRIAQGLFQADDLLAHRRLRAVNAFARACEASSIDDGDEAMEKVEIQHGAPFDFPLDTI